MCVKTEANEPTFQELLKEFMDDDNKPLSDLVPPVVRPHESGEAEGGEETIV